jgi:hypothetical protein
MMGMATTAGMPVNHGKRGQPGPGLTGRYLDAVRDQEPDGMGPGEDRAAD